MQKVIHKSDSRGYFDHGWLKTHHSFSFGNYYNPARVHFGKLRVLNDDIVAPNHGFGTHQHDNMEIVSIPLSGVLAHKDSKGHEEVIKPNDVQVMSAGAGISHSEYNHSNKDAVNFLQIWILPDARNHEPRYAQKTFDRAKRKNKFLTVILPRGNDGSLWLHQDSYFSLADIDEGKSLEYRIHTKSNGIYLFVIDGEVEIEGEKLGKRDGIGIWDTEGIKLGGASNAEVLLIEVPMN